MHTQASAFSAPIDFSKPVGYYARLGTYADHHLTLGALANWMYEQHRSSAAVIAGTRYLGTVSHRSLLRAIERGVPLFAPISDAIDPEIPVLGPRATVGEALDILEKTGMPGVEIVDEDGYWVGTFVVSSLLTRKDQRPRPRMVGGMATFGGVYLTNGSIGAGAKWYDLALVGVVLSTLWMISVMVTIGAISGYSSIQPLLGPLRIFDPIAQFGFAFLPMLLFLMGMRLLPLAGVHAAEHKVVHAIERGEPLELEVVASMPREHPRCGTNLVMALLMFMIIMSLPLPLPEAFKALLAAFIAIIFFRPLGTFAQRHFTTKEPNRQQLEMGIRAGNELLDRYALGEGSNQTILSRIWSSGILIILASAATTAFLVSWILSALLRVNLGLF